MLSASDRRLAWLVLAGSCALRLPGLFHDFWFDEVWSYLLVRTVVVSPLDILTRLHIDNNHPLNSWFLYVLGDHSAWVVYRIPALLFGVASVAVAGHIMSRRGRAHAMIAMILIAASYPLVVYSSEARGYGPMTFFVLLAVDAHERYLDTSGWTPLIVMWIAVVLGLLSHLTFLQAYGAILLWSVYAEARRGRDLGASAARLAWSHTIPLMFLAILYLIYVRHLSVAGAEPAPLASVLMDTIAVTAGTPGRGVWPWIAGALLIGLFGGGLRVVKRIDTGLFVFFLSGIVLLPGLMIVTESWNALIAPRFFPRYFLVSITLFLLLSAWLGGEYCRRREPMRLAVTLAVFTWITGNLWQVVMFARDGRGHYQEAVDYMAHATHDSDVRVSSNSDFRTNTLLTFYRRYLPAGKTLTFYFRNSPQTRDAEWRIVEDVEPRPDVPDQIIGGSGSRLLLVKRLPFYGMSGSQWSIYERADAIGKPTPGARPTP